MTTSEAPDLGPSGAAFTSRPSRVVVIEGKSRGSVATERIEARRMDDATLVDLLHHRSQINDRQHAAGLRLARLWTAAGLNPRVSADYGRRAARGAQNGPDEALPIDAYRSVMRDMPARYAPSVEAMLCEQHPGVARLDELHAGLDWLAELWGESGEDFGDDHA